MILSWKTRATRMRNPGQGLRVRARECVQNLTGYKDLFMTQICTGFNPCQYMSYQTTQKRRGMWEERSPQKAEAVWHLRPGLHLHLCDNKDAWGRGYTLN